MAKTKKYYAEIVLRDVNSRDRNRDEKLDLREIYQKLDQVTNKYARLNLFENMRMDDKSVNEQFITTFKNVAIQQNTEHNGLPYSELPAKYAALPHGKGIVEIRPVDKPDLRFIPMGNNQYKQMRNNYANRLGGYYGFFPEENRIYYVNKDISVKKVNIRLVITDASQINNDSVYPIPPDYEDIILMETTQWFLQTDQLNEDKVNDGVNLK